MSEPAPLPDPVPESTTRYSLTLYVSAGSPRSMEAVETLRRLIDSELPGQVDLEIVDVHDEPALLLRDQVLVAPTLVKRLPEPLRRLVGDLSNTARVRVGLDLDLDSGRTGAEPD